MAGEIPVKVASGRLHRFEIGDYVQVANGGTGLTTVAASTVLGAEVEDTIAALTLSTGLTVSGGVLTLADALIDIATIADWATGDLLVYDGANLINVGVGNDDDVLMADSGETGGVKWAPLPAMPTAGHEIQEEGVGLTQRAGLNFVGDAITATDNGVGDSTDITLASALEDIADIAGWTKGDILVYDGANVTRLGVGDDDKVLIADSGEATGLAWADASGGGHTIQEEGVGLTQRTNLNFIGGYITAADDGVNDATTVTIEDPLGTDHGGLGADASGWSGSLYVAAGVVGTTTGTTNYLAKWADENSLEDSTIAYDSGTAIGIGTATPRRILDVLDAANPQIRITQADNAVYVDFLVDANGDLTITPTGGRICIGPSAVLGAGTRTITIGDDAGCVGMSGTDCFMIGYRAGNALTTGNNNMLWGYEAGKSITSGPGNICIGYQADASALLNAQIVIGYQAVGLGANSVVLGRASYAYTNGISIGYGAGGATLAADKCTFVGTDSGKVVTSGTGCTFLGMNAGKAATTGTYNTFLGFGAGGLGVATGASNTAVGYNALEDVVDGANNVAIGLNAAANLTSASHGVYVGRDAGAAGVGGDNVVAVGRLALNNVTGAGNIGVGYSAGASITSGAYNLALGYAADCSALLGTQIAIGYQATSAAASTIVIGQAAAIGGTGSIAIGYDAGVVTATGIDNILLGYQSGNALTTGTGNLFCGHQSGIATTDGTYNTYLGYQARGVATADYQVIIGYSAAAGGDYAVAIGGSAGAFTNVGDLNIMIGCLAGDSVTSGNNGIFIGYDSDGAATVNYQLAIGSGAITGGASAVAIGHAAKVGVYGIAIGDTAGAATVVGTDSICIGRSAGDSITSGTYNTAIGYTADCGAENNYQIAIGYAAIAGGNDTISIGRDSGAVGMSGANGINIGYQAGNALTTGGGNCLLGYTAGDSITEGSYNVVIGYQADGAATISAQVAIGQAAIGLGADSVSIGNAASAYTSSVAIGKGALSGATGIGTVSIGYLAGDSFTTGDYNVCIGYEADGAATINYQIAVGYGAVTSAVSAVALGRAAAIGAYGIAIGDAAGAIALVGTDTVCIGRNAGDTITSGTYGIFLGYDSDGVNTADYQIAVGYQAATLAGGAIAFGKSVRIGVYGVAIGYETGAATAVGTDNVCIGRTAGSALTSGTNSVLLGFEAGNSLTESVGSIAIGYTADGNATASYQTAIGYGAISSGHSSFCGGRASKAGQGSVGIGYNCDATVTDTVAIGDTASTLGSSAGAVAVGYDTLASGSGAIAIGGVTKAPSAYGISIGDAAGGAGVVGAGSICIGRQAGDTITTGVYNTAIGHTSDCAAEDDYQISIGYASITGGDNTISLGRDAGNVGMSGANNVLIGYQAGNALTTGDSNCLIGKGAGDTFTINQYSVCLGFEADGTAGHNYMVAIGYQAVGTGGSVAIGASSAAGGSYTVVLGYDAGISTASGSYSVLLGYQAGNALTTGPGNILQGYRAGDTITEGDYNICIGYDADGAAAVDYQIAIGHTAVATAANAICLGRAASVGTYGIAIGDAAGGALVAGTNNICVGTSAGDSITSGTYNICMGYQSDAAATVSYQTSVGYQAICESANTIAIGRAVSAGGDSTICIGYDSGNTGMSGNYGICIGPLAGNALTTAIGSIFLGYRAGNTVDGGHYSIAIGYDADCTAANTYQIAIGGLASSTGQQSVAIGYSAQAYTHNVCIGNTAQSAGTYNTCLGYKAGAATMTGTSNLILTAGSSGCTGITNGTNNVLINTGNIVGNGTYNVLIGYSPGAYLSTNQNVCIGYQAGYGFDAATTADYVIAIGQQSCRYVHDGASCNIGIGIQALMGDAVSGITGDYNTALQSSALRNITSGSGNFGVGYQAGDAITSGTYNICLGYQSDAAATSSYQIAIGYTTVTTAGNSIAIGRAAKVGTYGIAIGDAAGGALVAGTNSICIGTSAGDSITSGTYNICLGYQADAAAASNYQIALGYQAIPTASDSVGIGRSSNPGANECMIGSAGVPLALTVTGALNHDGTTVGLFGAAPVAQSAGWTTFANLSSDKTCDADATTVEELADILGTLIEYLKTLGPLAA